MIEGLGTTLIVGFDSAWTAANSGAIVGALRVGDGRFLDLGPPLVVNFEEAERVILDWMTAHAPSRVLVFLDQPTIVRNAARKRPVEDIVSSPVGRRHGGMQPANTGRTEMFGPDAPVWPFLAEFGGPGDPMAPVTDRQVFETYPVLAMIALGWVLPDSRATGRLPKYNPERRKTYSDSDWRFVCDRTAGAFRRRGLTSIAEWIDAMSVARPRKSDQDGLDACVCLLVAMHLTAAGKGLMVGDLQTGYIVVPYEQKLRDELDARCSTIRIDSAEFVRAFRLIVSK